MKRLTMPQWGGLLRSRTFWACTLAAPLILATLPVAEARSNAIERNLPPAPQSGEGDIRIDPQAAGNNDETPLGVTVTGISLIGANDPVPVRSKAGVVITGVGAEYAPDLSLALAPFIGKPLSHALIAQMQGAVAGVWRQAGYPFMSVTVPPQEVTSGVLTLRVVEFTAGAVKAGDAGLADHIRQQTGQPISAPQLSEDLDWLNRNPFRQVGAVLEPGDQYGASDIALSVSEQRPVSVYAGWDNSGSVSTGRNRWFTGGGAWIPGLNDLTLGWRLTRSDALWADPFALDTTRPDYLGLAGRVDLPTLPRQALSIAPNYVASNELLAGTPLSFTNTTFELPILYRSAISNLLPAHYLGDVYVGIEPKWLSRDTRFAGVSVAHAEAGLVNLVLGWSQQFADSFGRTDVDLFVKANPGGLINLNTAADWDAFTNGRVSQYTYVLAGFDIARVTALPHDFNWLSSLSGQITDKALPDTERLGLGGYYAVRGFDSDDVSVDSGIIWRNELRLPTLSPLKNSSIADSLSPFAFLDLGQGVDIGTATAPTLVGTGLGFDYAIGQNFNASATAAMALTAAGSTKPGDWSITSSLRFTY